VRYAADDEGRAGFRRYRSHIVEPIDRCLIARPAIQDSDVTSRRWSGGASIEVAESGDGSVQVQARREDGSSIGSARTGKQTHVRMHALDRDWRVSVGGFWQVHPGAGDALVAAVMDGLKVSAGERCLDLYAGAGLFAFALAEAVGAEGRVVAVESDEAACRDARRNLHAQRQVDIVPARVDVWLRETKDNESDLDVVCLDPPRSGAGTDVVKALAARTPRAVAYVACDPAALARDVATFGEFGYRLDSLRAFDIFPMTHHVECVAVMRQDRSAKA
jgi:tRNA/tmRNA/rRNA uracil-C5-methylase (TrmA/RlmC/RlmD family)